MIIGKELAEVSQYNLFSFKLKGKNVTYCLCGNKMNGIVHKCDKCCALNNVNVSTISNCLERHVFFELDGNDDSFTFHSYGLYGNVKDGVIYFEKKFDASYKHFDAAFRSDAASKRFKAFIETIYPISKGYLREVIDVHLKTGVNFSLIEQAFGYPNFRGFILNEVDKNTDIVRVVLQRKKYSADDCFQTVEEFVNGIKSPFLRRVFEVNPIEFFSNIHAKKFIKDDCRLPEKIENVLLYYYQNTTSISLYTLLDFMSNQSFIYEHEDLVLKYLKKYHISLNSTIYRSILTTLKMVNLYNLPMNEKTFDLKYLMNVKNCESIKSRCNFGDEEMDFFVNNLNDNALESIKFIASSKRDRQKMLK